jgi:hypothetical protein
MDVIIIIKVCDLNQLVQITSNFSYRKNAIFEQGCSKEEIFLFLSKNNMDVHDGGRDHTQESDEVLLSLHRHRARRTLKHTHTNHSLSNFEGTLTHFNHI